MPHEVIMPALGMAQDAGTLTAWLKRPGERVAAGEALMEVETDKATVEVEAAADGWLTEVRAEAGQSVPVGAVVALIAETADGAGEAPRRGAGAAAETAAGSAGPETADGAGEAPRRGAGAAAEAAARSAGPELAAPAEGRAVIMPALGMAQDSGRIVAWSKAPGDRVAAGDVLFEVETDKAVMEVPAGHDGWLAEVRAAAGEDVPVGEVIAVISAGRPAEPRSLSRSEAAGAGPAPVADAPPAGPQAVAARGEAAGAAGTGPVARADALPAGPQAAVEANAPKPAAEPATGRATGRETDAPAAPPRPEARRAAPGGRILASPKARRLAAERGLDLRRLVEAGHAPPFHAADVETLAALEAPAAAAGRHAARIEAEVPAEGLEAFCAWSRGEGTPVPRHRALLGFAAAALRGPGRDGPLHVGIARPGRAGRSFADPDRVPLGAAPEPADAAPDLVLRDLTQSRLTGVSTGAGPVPVLTVARRGGCLALTLDFDAGTLDPDAAIALVDAVAARIEDPLRHLL